MKSLFGSHIELTSRVLDMQLQRQNMINGNIANIKTEGYRPRSVDALRPFVEQIEAHILNLAGVTFDKAAEPGKLRAIA